MLYTSDIGCYNPVFDTKKTKKSQKASKYAAYGTF